MPTPNLPTVPVERFDLALNTLMGVQPGTTFVLARDYDQLEIYARHYKQLAEALSNVIDDHVRRSNARLDRVTA